MDFVSTITVVFFVYFRLVLVGPMTLALATLGLRVALHFFFFSLVAPYIFILTSFQSRRLFFSSYFVVVNFHYKYLVFLGCVARVRAYTFSVDFRRFHMREIFTHGHCVLYAWRAWWTFLQRANENEVDAHCVLTAYITNDRAVPKNSYMSATCFWCHTLHIHFCCWLCLGWFLALSLSRHKSPPKIFKCMYVWYTCI